MSKAAGTVPASVSRYADGSPSKALQNQGGAVPKGRPANTADRSIFKARRQQVKPSNVLHLLHRLGILMCAVVFIVRAAKACVTALALLRDHDNPSTYSSPDTFTLAGTWLGASTLQQSPLVTIALKNSTIPTNGTIYLESEQEASFSFCRGANGTSRAIFADAFQRTVFAAITINRTQLRDLDAAAIELIVPIVDCSNSLLQKDDASCTRFFFLVRDRANPIKLAVVVVSMSNQEYALVEQRENGPAAVATVQIVRSMDTPLVAASPDNPGNAAFAHFLVSIGYPYEAFDFRAFDYLNTTRTGMWTLRSKASDNKELRKVLETARQDGFYIKAETEQANMNNWVWSFPTDPQLAVSAWQWISTPVLKDTWAWVHGLQFVFGISALANLVTLVIATYRNVRAGHLWIGDAFVDISSNALLRGLLVLISWFVNEFWCLHEFCIIDGFRVMGHEGFVIYEPPMQADLMTLFYSLSGIIGRLMYERIDPLFVTVLFELSYGLRMHLRLPIWQQTIETYTTTMIDRGILPPVDGQRDISPMRFATTSPLGPRNWVYAIAVLFPIFRSLLYVIAFALIKKLYRRLKDRTKQRSAEVYADNTDESQPRLSSVRTKLKHVLTLFENATGAQLEDRYGLVCEYDRNVYFRGLKFASADGIYSSGFLIANGKFLVQTDDVWLILGMKIFRKRLWNVHVHEIAGTTVQQSALLVYPQTLTFADLARLNVMPLT